MVTPVQKSAAHSQERPTRVRNGVLVAAYWALLWIIASNILPLNIYNSIRLFSNIAKEKKNLAGN